MRFWTWLLARLLAVAVILGLALWYRMPDSGQREFRRSMEALKRVNSLHYAMVQDQPMQHFEMEGDLVCPDDSFREATHIILRQPHNQGTLDTEVRRIDGKPYAHMNSGMWAVDYQNGRSPRVTCPQLVSDAGIPVLPNLDEMVRRGIITKGDKKTINGEVCREWQVTLRRVPGPLLPRSPEELEHRTLCLGADDHLPREMSGGDSEHWTYAFNTPANIDKPADLAPERTWETPQSPASTPPGLTLSDTRDDN
jgi:hypothetical protein